MNSKTKKREPQRVNLGSSLDPIWIEIDEYTIDLGSGGKGYRRYKVLVHLCRDAIKLSRKRLDFDDANLLYDWCRSVSKFRREQSPFTIALDAHEYGALSRALRALGTGPASTMYQWFGKHRTETHVQPCPCASCLQ